MKLINLTPHALNILTVSGEIVLPPSGGIARLTVSRDPRPAILTDSGEEIPVCSPTMGTISGLPDPEPGTALVVSALVADAAKRPDVFSPGELVRDADGKPVGCRGLCSF